MGNVLRAYTKGGGNTLAHSSVVVDLPMVFEIHEVDGDDHENECRDAFSHLANRVIVL
jgi:hypothetical protein